MYTHKNNIRIHKIFYFLEVVDLTGQYKSKMSSHALDAGVKIASIWANPSPGSTTYTPGEVLLFTNNNPQRSTTNIQSYETCYVQIRCTNTSIT